ncbi:MAG: hypothetical protein SRB2_02775 [Desulfobacteraceae bacterium Eth-SRB2]|nr:MAG: hypothetical protein SRB2_02775 [Desulfobacteraceae bacterium Eth-SRB2]
MVVELDWYCFSDIHSIAEKCEVVRDGRTRSLIFVGQLLVGNRKKAGFYGISDTANGGVDSNVGRMWVGPQEHLDIIDKTF